MKAAWYRRNGSAQEVLEVGDLPTPVPAAGEVTYVWGAGPDAVAMHTAYGKEMPGHCAIYFGSPAASRRLSCVPAAAWSAGARSSTYPGPSARSNPATRRPASRRHSPERAVTTSPAPR